MYKYYLLFLLTGFFQFNTAVAEEQKKRQFHVIRAEKAPEIDGNLNDPSWITGEWQGDFIQHEPREGIAPSQKTEFCILYDNTNLYVAIKAYDLSPDSIVKRMTRRDYTDGDVVSIIFDSYHDLRTAFSFSVSAAGVKQDLIYSEDGDIEDLTWDPIWYVKTATYNWGWAAEMKIPLTQLRFNASSLNVWGLNLIRQIFRLNENSLWQETPRDASGFIHFMGEMEGFENLKPHKQFDLMPYVTGGYESFSREEGNPFSTGEKWTKNMGIDGKIGLTNNMTLDFTINPDFGQVEADPSEVNLTAFETFFQEKRPFFIEGKNITNFGIGIGDGDIGNDNLFYSRRIGRRPQRDLDLADNEYSDAPSFTSILGAAKLTGKTENGWSVGIIESLTQQETAQIDLSGIRRKETVEPLSNYFISRIQKDFNKGNTIIGGLYTNTLRDLNSETKDEYHKSAQTAGIDFTQFFKDKNWLFSINTSISNVKGTREAIAGTQESPVHYFQRPDASYINYDINKKSLMGHGGIVSAGKVGGKWNYMFFGLWKSPGLELNDVGYLRQADQLMGIWWGAYHINNPFSIFREMHFNSDYYSILDFGGDYITSGYEVSVSTQLKNFWHINLHTNINTNGRDKTMLRGGPSIKVPGESNFYMFLRSDDRKKLSVGLEGGFSKSYFNSQNFRNYSLSLNYRPFNSLLIEIVPGYTQNKNQLQYIDNIDYQNSTQYIFGTLKQDVFNVSARVNLSLTPNFTIQFWGQPFAAAGSFKDFKKITDYNASAFVNRFEVFNPAQLNYNIANDEFEVDDNRDGVNDFSFENPSFNKDEYLSNMVVRWEFVPGSTVFFVWSQKRDYDSNVGSFSFKKDLKNMFSNEKPYNVFLIKFSYRIGLR